MQELSLRVPLFVILSEAKNLNETPSGDPSLSLRVTGRAFRGEPKLATGCYHSKIPP